MFCSNCGSEVEDGAKFCSSCGMPMGEAESQLTDAAEGQAPQQPPAPDAAEAMPTQPIEQSEPQPGSNVAQPAATKPTEEMPQVEQPPAPTGTPAGDQPPAPTGMPSTPHQPSPGAPTGAAATTGTSSDKQPWYGKTWVIILFLLFFWPVGLVFMWMKSCKWQKVAKIVITVVIGLTVIGGIATIVSACNELSNVTTENLVNIEIGDKKSSKSSSSASNSASSSSSSKGQSSKGSDKFDSKAWADGQPTLWAYINYSPEKLVELCDSHDGYGLSSNKEYEGKVNSAGMMVGFGVSDAVGNAYSLDNVDRLKPIGQQGSPMQISASMDYKTLDDAVAAGKVTKKQSAYSSDGKYAILVLADSKDNEVLAMGFLEKGMTGFYLYNQDYVKRGYLDDEWDSGQSGMTISQWFQSYFATHSSGWRLAG